MALIQCADSCKFQFDGYCTLEKCTTVTNVKKDCPYYIPQNKGREETKII